MTILKKKIELLIREIDPKDKNGRYLRENLRRIKQFFDDIISGNVAVAISETSLIAQQSPDAFNYYETQLVTSNGQTVFNLLNMPASPTKVAMQVNGQTMTNGVHFTVAGQIVTFIPSAAGFILEVSNEFGQPDQIIFQYVRA